MDEAKGETIYITRGSLIQPQDWGVLTSKQKTRYAHITKNQLINTQFYYQSQAKKLKSVCFMKTKHH